jgi:hypothetical protein
VERAIIARTVAGAGGVRYTGTVRARDIAAFAHRDWQTVADCKQAQWLTERRRRGVRWCLEVAEGLRRQVLQRHPEWPSADERQHDLDTHVRVGTALRRVRYADDH